LSGVKRERVLIAMSGGVDSSLAAARLLDAGYDVVGCTLHLWDYPDDGSNEARCCAPEDQYDARRVADVLGFAHYSFDRRELFARVVVEPFIEAYLAGETPSPCTACNRGVKLGELFTIADRLGAAKVATGHYARVGRDGDVPTLLTGKDDTKDQSYFLFATPPEQLARLMFPLGDSTKAEVRAEALARNLPGASKGESQELCFVGHGQGAYAKFVEGRAKGRVRPGPIVDANGRVVGNHEGIHRFTVGQRKGLGVALGVPTFVNEIDSDTGTVHLGSDESLGCQAADLADVVMLPGVVLPRAATIRVRYRHRGAPGKIRAIDGGAKVVFDEPTRAVTKGQVAVFYDGDRVLGGGRIVSVERATTHPPMEASP
jgi:tRNA-uridine 2-sulfurtransferase